MTPEETLNKVSFPILSRLQSGTEDVVSLADAIAAVAAARVECAKIAGRYAEKWYQIHSHVHMNTTLAAHKDFRAAEHEITSTIAS